MSLPNIILLGFGEMGALTAQSLTTAQAAGINARYVPLNGTIKDISTPRPEFWASLKKTIAGENETLVIWAQDSLIVWDRLERALALNHQPDFLWPLSLAIENGALTLPESDLFLAVGAYEISLYGFMQLGGFQHVARARALFKLLEVSDIQTLTLGGYLSQSWDNFESVKAPDAWLIRGNDDLSFAPVVEHINDHNGNFKFRHMQWVMSREGLDAKTRNTLAASDFARNNLDVMHDRMERMMTSMPYYGFWPFKHFIQPVSGYHPAVAINIWQGDYQKQAMDFWRGLFCQGAYTHVLDCHDDGHVFGLTFLNQNERFHASFCSPDINRIAWAVSALEANNIAHRAEISTGIPLAVTGGIAVVAPDNISEALWGKMDLFIVLNGVSAISQSSLPEGYTALGGEAGQLNIKPVSLNNLDGLAVLFILSEERAAAMTGGR